MKLKIIILFILNTIIIYGQTEEIIEIEEKITVNQVIIAEEQQKEVLFNFLIKANRPKIFTAKTREDEEYLEALYYTKYNTILEDFFDKIIEIKPVITTGKKNDSKVIHYTVQPSSDFFITHVSYRIMGTLPEEVNTNYVKNKEHVYINDLMGNRQFKPQKHSVLLRAYEDYLEQRNIAKHPDNWKELDLKLVVISLTFSFGPHDKKIKLTRFDDSKAIKRLNALLLTNPKLKDLHLKNDKKKYLKKLKSIQIPSKKVWSHEDFDCKNKELEELYLYRKWGKNYETGAMYTLTDCICEFKKIKKIKFNNHEIDKIPTCLASLNNLSELILPKNKILKLPENIGAFKQLKTLVMSDNYIQKIPKSISKLNQIVFIDLSNNYLETIPKELAELTSLKRLDLSNNHIQKIPKNIDKLNQIEFIDLSNNNLEAIPKELGQLKSLKKIDLRWNMIPHKQLNKLERKLNNCEIIR